MGPQQVGKKALSQPVSLTIVCPAWREAGNEAGLFAGCRAAIGSKRQNLQSLNALPVSHNTPALAALGAGNGTRTRDPELGRLALYQLSYSRPAIRPLVERGGFEPPKA